MSRRRIGHRMIQIADYVQEHPGCTMLAAVESLVYHGGRSRQYGYRAAWRAVKAGLVMATGRADKAGCYRLYPIAAA